MGVFPPKNGLNNTSQFINIFKLTDNFVRYNNSRNIEATIWNE